MNSSLITKMRAASAVKDFSIMFGVNNNLSLIWHRNFTSVPKSIVVTVFPVPPLPTSRPQLIRS
jgi:hypothetical protein